MQPKTHWRFPDQAGWPADWQIHEKFGQTFFKDQSLPLWKAGFPYLLIGVLLVIIPLPGLPFRSLMDRFDIVTTPLLGTGITASYNPFNSPGTVFILVVIVCLPLIRMHTGEMLAALKSTTSAFINTAVVLVVAVPMVRIFIIQSGVNASGLSSMPIELARAIADQAGQAWPFFAAPIGALGSFIAGSNTVSNLTFVLFQFEVGIKTNLSPVIIVSLQAVGGAAGNMIYIHNIVAVSATCGLYEQEGNLIRKTIIPTCYYLITAGVTGWLLLH